MLEYSSLSDLELHALYLSGDTTAGDTLVLRYRRLVKICIRPYFLAGGDSEDLLQEGMIGLLSAIREYDPDFESSFHSFAELCIRRRVISAARGAARCKHAPLNDGLSLEQLQSGQMLERVCVPSAEDLVLEKSRTEDFVAASSHFLSGFETDILTDYLEGLSYVEMAQRRGRSEKSVDNAVQRIRKKLARHLSISGDFS